MNWQTRLLQLAFLSLSCSIAYSNECVEISESATLSELHSVFSDSNGQTVFLCPGFSISGTRCDVNSPFLVSSRTSLRMHCLDRANGATGLCEISCPGNHFTVEAGGLLQLIDITLKGATATSIVVKTYGYFVGVDSTWEGNINSDGYGGAIYSESSSAVQIAGCTFFGNQASIDGGAMYLRGQVFIYESTISNNVAEGGRGGGIFGSNKVAEGGRGGGIFFADDVTATVMFSTFLENFADVGPAIFSEFSRSAIDIAQNEGCGNVATTIECEGEYDGDSDICNTFFTTCSPPTEAPSGSPTGTPSASPSVTQTELYIRVPTTMPTLTASSKPSASPSTIPPSAAPSLTPSARPTSEPSSLPSTSLSSVPSSTPSGSLIPTPNATTIPTSLPSVQPSSQLPSSIPSGIPSVYVPSNVPSGEQSNVPSSTPVREQSNMPSNQESSSLSPSYMK